MQTEEYIRAIHGYTEGFTPISLKETSSIELMNRYDTKYLFSFRQLGEILQECKDAYLITTESDASLFLYRNLYLDTVGRQMFLAHHNGRLHRYKIRLREYAGFNLVYLEVKEKFKGKTRKTRTLLTDTGVLEQCVSDPGLNSRMDSFIADTTPFRLSQLSPAIHNSFHRITIVHRSKEERITIDTLLHYSWGKTTVSNPGLVIAEVKHQAHRPTLEFERLLKAHSIRPGRFSKYCIGSIQTSTVKKYNNFKEILLHMVRLGYEQSPS
jgi:hypothetical protein